MQHNHFELLADDCIREKVSKAFSEYQLKNKRVLVIIPDNSRTAPIDIFFKLFYDLFGKEVKKLDYLVALGTHPLLTEEEKFKRVGISSAEKEKIYKDIAIMNHRWDKKETFVNIGSIDENEMEDITEGLMKKKADISVNRIIFDYDIILVIGPVFPHEIVGFSGSSKYFFPGICGWNFTDITHWLAALRTNIKTIGKRDTPVRRLLDHAVKMIKTPVVYFNLVVDSEGLKGLFIGSEKSAWEKAVDLSSKINIRYTDRIYKTVLSLASKNFDDFWTGAKSVYKIEPIVEDGGEIVVYAPHIEQFSIVHGAVVDKIGFHIKEYFLNNESVYEEFPKAVLAFSTLVKGTGRFRNGVEEPRITVTLATGISKERCESLNLKYKDPAEIDVADWENKQEDGRFVVHNSGEVLYRIKNNME